MSALRGNSHLGRSELPPDLAAAQALSAMRRPAELLLLAALLMIYGLAYALEFPDLYQTMNLVGPAALMAILGWSCYRMVRRSSIAVWAPLFWFRVACAAYYGFGALVPHIVNEETRQYILALYNFDDVLNFKVNFIYCAGIFWTILFSYLFLPKKCLYWKSGYADGGVRKSSQTLFFALCFLLIGGGLRYAFVLPHAFGLTEFVLPGMFMTLSNMYYVGIYLLIVYGMNHKKNILPIVSALIGIEIAVSVASFAKTELLLTLVFSFLGFVSRDVSKAKILVGASCVLFAYFAFQPLVGYGRAELFSRYERTAGAGFDERWEIVQSYLDGGRDAVISTQQGGLLRLSYVSIGAFVVDRYDSGVPGNTLGNAAAVIIPRALWPDKPIISQLGGDLYFLVRGRDGTSLGVGHFAEAYWNFGWTGIIPLMGILATILSVFSRISMRIMSRKDWLFLPVVFVGVNIGLRVDGHFVLDILGPLWIAICLGLALMVIKPLLSATVLLRMPVVGGVLYSRGV